MTTEKLEKAKLISSESETIVFMFNPKELSFSQSLTLEEESGARTERGLPKVAFAHPNPCTLTISNIILDTYEQGTSVLQYINKFKKAVEFAEKGSARNQRPPTYIFTWGQQKYLRCLVEQLSYKLTRFLPDGTPVQATVDLTLKEVDESFSSGGMTPGRENGPNR